MNGVIGPEANELGGYNMIIQGYAKSPASEIYVLAVGVRTMDPYP